MCAEIAQLLLGDFAFNGSVLHFTLLKNRGQVLVGRNRQIVDLCIHMSFISVDQERSRTNLHRGQMNPVQTEKGSRSRDGILPRRLFD